MTAVTLTGVGLTFAQGDRRTEVLRGVDLEVAEGSFAAIVGPSGAGKSTLLRLVAGLIPPSAGDVSTSGARAAMVFQEARLLPWRRALGNAAFGLEGTELSRAQREHRATVALAQVGLISLADRWPHQLSGGQRQRVGLARALAVEPGLLLMDEPFGALDAITREALQDDLLALWRRTGKTILFVTHDIDEATYLADQVIVLGGAPAHVSAVIDVTAERPRRRGDQALATASMRVRAALDGTDGS